MCYCGVVVVEGGRMREGELKGGEEGGRREVCVSVMFMAVYGRNRRY